MHYANYNNVSMENKIIIFVLLYYAITLLRYYAMPGAQLQLAAYGPQDVYLSGNPQITFFVAVYKRHTNFAIESIEQLFHGDINYGKKVFIIIDRIGDLMHEIFLNVTLPTINPLFRADVSDEVKQIIINQVGDYHCSWTNAIGLALIKNVEIEIGGVVIDRQFGQWMDIWGELTVDASQRDAYNEMIGKHEHFNSTLQEKELTLRVPLYFWFCRNKGLALPLIALQNHEVRINLTFRDFNDLWVSNTGTFIVCRLYLLRITRTPNICTTQS
jgi:hypothetical protein